MKECKINLTKTKWVKEETEHIVIPGELILFQFLQVPHPDLGVFAEFVEDVEETAKGYLCLAEQHHRLIERVDLPGRKSLPIFKPQKGYKFNWVENTPKNREKYKGNFSIQEDRLYFDSRKNIYDECNGWIYFRPVSRIFRLIVGRDEIVEELKRDPKRRYSLHADLISRIEQPYVNDPKIREKLGIG